MKAKRKIKKYLTKGIRKVRYRKGFGVHSPFAFSLITQVIGEKTPFYAYEEILQLKKKCSRITALLPKFVSLRLPSTKILFLLYRLINRFQSQHLLEIGNQGGLVSYVMGLPNTTAELISIGADADKLEQAAALFDQETPHNHCFIHGEPVKVLGELPEGYRADFIYIHAEAARHADELYAALRERIHPHTVILIESIKTDKNARRLWNYFRYSPEIRVSLDLYEVGVAIGHDRFYKQHYIVSF